MTEKLPYGETGHLPWATDSEFRRWSTEMSEALLIGSLRQHELVAEKTAANERLQSEIAEHERTAAALREAQALLAKHALELEGLVGERTARLQETVGELEAFSYSIAHDMRAPLRAMRGFAELILSEHSAQLDETGEDYLRRIAAAAKRLDQLVIDVLHYSRASRQELTLQPVDVAAVIDDAIRTLPELQPPRAQIELVTPLHLVMAHEPSLMQCVTNVLSNAVKFVAPGVLPKIRVRSEKLGQRVRLWFEDNGIGIASVDRERIFVLFGRLNPRAAFEGTGIGLTIVRKAVERMGGSIGVESDAGQGTRVWLEFAEAAP